MSGTLYYDTRYDSTREVCHWIVDGIRHKAVAIQRIGEVKPGQNADEFIIIGSPIYVGMDLITGYFQVEGECSLLWDQLFAFRGLDAMDLENYYLVAEYIGCLRRFGKLERTLGELNQP